ncbi:MAG: hypothetical protein SF053_16380 [Bacteroidia bacterium]|nr:hypothetical protein [Bacteroidia bacterium]
MANEKLRLPFSIDVYQGLGRLDGLMSLQQDVLVLEFQIKDTLVGGIRSRPKTLHLDLNEVDYVKYSQNLFGARFVIQAHTLAAVAAIPTADKGEVRLSIARKDREQARRMESHINLRISELRLDVHERGESLLGGS